MFRLIDSSVEKTNAYSSIHIIELETKYNIKHNGIRHQDTRVGPPPKHDLNGGKLPCNPVHCLVYMINFIDYLTGEE